MNLCDQIRHFPAAPGVYVMRDAGGEVLYVGKANQLRRRLASYFKEKGDDRYQIRFLMARVDSIEPIVTDTEKEAILLEQTLIRQHKPKYNIFLKDDKTFVRIRLGVEHAVPRISTTRRMIKDGALYFGPYTSAAACREVVEHIIRWFKLRSCTDRDFANRSRPCLQYQIGRCTAPCVGYVSRPEYARQVEKVRRFLRGEKADVIRMLKAEMKRHSEARRYEAAALARDVIRDIAETLEKQKMICAPSEDRDVIGWVEGAGLIGIHLFAIRGGVLQVSRQFIFTITESPRQTLGDFFLQYYKEAPLIPREILLSETSAGFKNEIDWLNQIKGSPVRVIAPSRGEKKRLSELARTNAVEGLQLHLTRSSAIGETLAMLANKLRLSRIPVTIECVDISNISGYSAVGAIVAFTNGEPDKSKYRLFTIRAVSGPNDYQMMFETLERRFRHAEWAFPGLLLVDGGKGQLQIAVDVLAKLAVGVPVAAIAKGQHAGEEDKIYVPGQKNEIILHRQPEVLNLLKRIRDETHRFAVTAHRRRRVQELFSAA